MTAGADTPPGAAPAPRLRSARTAPVQPTPTDAPARAALRLPAFWMVVLLLLAGAGRIGVFLHRAVADYPLATATAVGLFALYAVPFWFFVTELDYLEREPPALLAIAFGWGALVATSVAIPGNAALDNLVAKLVSPEIAAAWGPAIAGPTVEELAKVSGLLAIVLIARSQINSVLDGVVYGALVGLGFQVVEDVVFAVAAVTLAGRGDSIAPVLTTFFLRGFLAGLWSHTLFGALAGAGIGYLVVRTQRSPVRRLVVAGLAVLGAWACHFLWNSPLLTNGVGHGGLSVLVLLLVKGAPPLAMIVVLVRAAHAREAAYYAAQLKGLADPRLVTGGELHVLRSGTRRAHARRHAYDRAGWRARRTVRRLQRVQAHLAVELSRAGPDPARSTAPVDRCRDELLALRQRLTALGHPEALVPAGEPGPWRRTAGTVGGTALALAVLWAAISALGGG